MRLTDERAAVSVEKGPFAGFCLLEPTRAHQVTFKLMYFGFHFQHTTRRPTTAPSTVRPTVLSASAYPCLPVICFEARGRRVTTAAHGISPPHILSDNQNTVRGAYPPPTPTPQLTSSCDLMIFVISSFIARSIPSPLSLSLNRRGLKMQQKYEVGGLVDDGVG